MFLMLRFRKFQKMTVDSRIFFHIFVIINSLYLCIQFAGYVVGFFLAKKLEIESLCLCCVGIKLNKKSALGVSVPLRC